MKETELFSIIRDVEEQWLLPLYTYVKAQFDGRLISHDHLHHYRVWEYTKQLLHQWSLQGAEFSLPEVKQCIIAVFFHDVGMIKTIDPSHGEESRAMCKAFLHHTVNDPDMPDPEPIFHAIAHHDDKTYQHGSAGRLLTLLQIADDLDAFGAIGIFRYSEIWILRQLPVNAFPEKIIPNAESRYNHFAQHIDPASDLFAQQTRKYHYIYRFFKTLREQIYDNKGNYEHYGPGALLRFFRNDVAGRQGSILKIPEYRPYKDWDTFGQQYMDTLRDELQSFHEHMI